MTDTDHQHSDAPPSILALPLGIVVAVGLVALVTAFVKIAVFHLGFCL